MTKTIKHIITTLAACVLLISCSLAVAADNDIIQILNVIQYYDVEIGKTYTIGSSIYYAITVQGDLAEPPYTREFDSDGNQIFKAVLDANGHPYTVSTSFVASQTKGIVNNTFNINRKDLEVPAKLIVFTHFVDANGRTLVSISESRQVGVKETSKSLSQRFLGLIGELTEIALYVPIVIAVLFVLIVLLMLRRSRLHEEYAMEPQILDTDPTTQSEIEEDDTT